VRQGLYDIAVMASEMLEIRCAMLKEAPAEKRARLLGREVAHATEACREFLSRFEADGKPPAKVDEEQERAYLTCRFHLARAHGKLDAADSLGASMQEYERIAAYIKANSVEGMEEEAKVCAEMAELLPHKIAAAQRGVELS
jgi:hypothetical protein